MNINISEKELKRMFEKAYEAGWHGCLNLKSSFSDNYVEEVFDSKLNKDSDFDVNGYYLNETYTVVNGSTITSTDSIAYVNELDSPYQQKFVFQH
jgi:hypothetical protein